MHRETEATGMVAWRRPKDITPVEQRRIAPLRARGGLVPSNGSQRHGPRSRAALRRCLRTGGEVCPLIRVCSPVVCF